MKIYYSSYELVSDHKLNNKLSGSLSSVRRMGFILKIIWDNGWVGYSDCHPLLEYGDSPTGIQIEHLRKGIPSDLVNSSLWLASHDAYFRSKKQNIFNSRTPLKNNFIVSDIRLISEDQLMKLKSQGFTKIKIKVGGDIKSEINFIERVCDFDFKIRLDFNSSSDFISFKNFVAQLSQSVLSRIEYVEDPFPFEYELWNEAKNWVPLAADFEYFHVHWNQIETVPFETVIIKPARMNVNEVVSQCLKFNLKFSVTSSMDHVIGCLGALSVAMDLKEKYGDLVLDPGCMTWCLFVPNRFSDSIVVKGPEVREVPGFGLGFDRLLEEETWHEVL